MSVADDSFIVLGKPGLKLNRALYKKPVRNNRKREFALSLALPKNTSYDALRDKNLMSYFSNPKKYKHLVKMKLVTKLKEVQGDYGINQEKYTSKKFSKLPKAQRYKNLRPSTAIYSNSLKRIYRNTKAEFLAETIIESPENYKTVIDSFSVRKGMFKSWSKKKLVNRSGYRKFFSLNTANSKAKPQPTALSSLELKTLMNKVKEHRIYSSSVIRPS